MNRQLEPFAVPAEEACRLLGGISRSTLYRLVLAGKLDRLDGGRMIITVASIARYTGAVTRKDLWP
jgi:predicted site-specific integrase-resolvase